MDHHRSTLYPWLVQFINGVRIRDRNRYNGTSALIGDLEASFLKRQKLVRVITCSLGHDKHRITVLDLLYSRKYDLQ